MASKPISPNRTHGKSATYIAGCRCSLCRAAHAARILRQQHRRAGQDHSLIEHGKSGYSNHGCRCDVCNAANREASRAYYAKRCAVIQSGYRPGPSGQAE